jgi:hypothetical protein
MNHREKSVKKEHDLQLWVRVGMLMIFDALAVYLSGFLALFIRFECSFDVLSRYTIMLLSMQSVRSLFSISFVCIQACGSMPACRNYAILFLP